MQDTKRFFRRFLEADPDRIHFAAHSHHFWPDVSFEAHVESWLMAARLADRKWEPFFSETWTKAQAHVARILNLPDSSTITFAPNTHELVSRVISALPRVAGASAKKSAGEAHQPVRILTTDGEFHSFARQSRRLEESGDAVVERIAAEPFATFPERFAVAARAGHFDLVLVSQVFFGSGYAVPSLEALVSAISASCDRETFVLVDGYHAFLALPTSLRKIAERVFYVAGGYKYAMAGEGSCFLHAPSAYGPRPVNTGWFAAFEDLSASGGAVGYAPGGSRFLGATFDPTAIHRFVAVMDFLVREGLGVERVHAHVLALQEQFAKAIDAAGLPFSTRDLLVPLDTPVRGHFLTFRTPAASALYEKLLASNIITDVRGDRLRMGFGLYHDASDIERGVARIKVALR